LKSTPIIGFYEQFVSDNSKAKSERDR